MPYFLSKDEDPTDERFKMPIADYQLTVFAGGREFVTPPAQAWMDGDYLNDLEPDKWPGVDVRKGTITIPATPTGAYTLNRSQIVAMWVTRVSDFYNVMDENQRNGYDPATGEFDDN